MLLYRDYESMVIQDYRKKRANSTLSLELIEPTPARLRDECLKICKNRYERKDEKTLVDFFEKTGDKEAWIRIIEGFDLDKFKPLVIFMKKSSATTSPKNIELLAWLIGFVPRPLETAKKLNSIEGIYEQIHPDEPTVEVSIDVQRPELSTIENKTPEPKISVREKVKKKGKKTIIVITILVALGMVIYLARIGKSSTHNITGHDACMYWSQDHYQPVSCSQRIENVQVIALDSEKVVNFRKITRPDTITENDLGSIWYTKYHSTYECYTAPGYHPIDSNLKLRPLTDYILLRYIRPDLQPAGLLTH